MMLARIHGPKSGNLSHLPANKPLRIDTIRSDKMSKRLNLVGQKFGRLTVQEFVGVVKRTSRWSCLCDCGNTIETRGPDLKNGNTKSCGCYMLDRVKETQTRHGQCLRNGIETRTHLAWAEMQRRCYDAGRECYKNYGGRGIKVCERWLGKEGFKNFYEDMGDCPEGMQLERKDNDGDYTPDNCRWATSMEQANNRRSSRWAVLKGERKTIAQWSRDTGIGSSTLLHRLNIGWGDERALTTPLRGLH
jgi:hypothetical protein